MAEISVIVPIYNVQKYLRKCLNSLVKPTLITISISCAPALIASVVSKAFTEDKLAPSGKPTTVHIFTFEPCNFCFARGI